jgi:hypothetical protein
MSDLISRSALLKKIAEEYDLNYGEILINPERFYEMVETVPTAYDIEKVVAELGEEKTMAYDNWDGGSSYQAYSQAIDIVRKGGVE